MPSNFHKRTGVCICVYCLCVCPWWWGRWARMCTPGIFGLWPVRADVCRRKAVANVASGIWTSPKRTRKIHYMCITWQTTHTCVYAYIRLADSAHSNTERARERKWSLSGRNSTRNQKCFWFLFVSGRWAVRYIVTMFLHECAAVRFTHLHLMSETIARANSKHYTARTRPHESIMQEWHHT